MTTLDVYSRLQRLYQLYDKAAEDAYESMQHFTEGRVVSLWYSRLRANSKLQRNPCDFPVLHLSHEKPQNHAIAERNIRDVVEGTRTTLIQAGLPPASWQRAGPAYCMFDNTEPREDGFIPWPR